MSLEDILARIADLIGVEIEADCADAERRVFLLFFCGKVGEGLGRYGGVSGEEGVCVWVVGVDFWVCGVVSCC